MDPRTLLEIGDKLDDTFTLDNIQDAIGKDTKRTPWLASTTSLGPVSSMAVQCHAASVYAVCILAYIATRP